MKIKKKYSLGVFVLFFVFNWNLILDSNLKFFSLSPETSLNESLILEREKVKLWQEISPMKPIGLGLVISSPLKPFKFQLKESMALIGYDLNSNRIFVLSFKIKDLNSYRQYLKNDDMAVLKDMFFKKITSGIEVGSNWRFVIFKDKEGSIQLRDSALTTVDLFEYLVRKGVSPNAIQVHVDSFDDEMGEKSILAYPNGDIDVFFENTDGLFRFASIDMKNQFKFRSLIEGDSNKHSLTLGRFELLFDVYSIRQKMTSDQIIQNWRQNKKVILDLGCGAHGEVVRWLRSRGVEAYGVDLIAYQEQYPYLIRGRAENLVELLDARGIQKVDMIVSISFFNEDYQILGKPILSDESLKRIVNGISKVLTPEGRILLFTDHSSVRLKRDLDTFNHFNKIVQLFNNKGVNVKSIVEKKDESDHVGFSGYFYGYFNKPLYKNELDRFGIDSQSAPYRFSL